LLKTASQSSWRMAKQESASNKRVESSKKLTDAEYESLFLELLEGVHQGWSRGNIGSFLIAKNISEAELVAWLHGFGERVLASSAVHDELAARLVQLGETASGELGQVSQSIGRLLLGKEKNEDLGSQDAESLLNQGYELEKLGKLEEAIILYEKILEFKPDYSKAWNYRGIALLHLGKYSEAIVSYEQAVEIQPDYYQAWCNRGNVLAHLGKYSEAIASYDRALEIQPDYYLAWHCQGTALGRLGKYEQGIASYERALEIQPDNYLAWYNRGVTLLVNLGRKEEAINSFDRALQYKSDFQEAFFSRGTALSNLRRYEEAIASYERALEYKPDYYSAWINRGVAAGKSASQDPFLANLSPIAKQNSELNKRGYEGKLASYREGLKYIHQDTHPEGWGSLHQRIGYAHYFQWKYHQRKNSQYWRNAIEEYNQAYKTLKDFPERHLDLLQDFIRAYLDVGKQEQAEELQRRAWDVFQDLLDKHTSPEKKRQLSLQYARLEQLTVDLALQKGELTKAWELAEKGKNACLTWLLAGWQEETAIDSSDYQEIQQLLTSTTAIVYWHISPNSFHTFVLKQGAETPILVTAPASSTSEQHTEPIEHLNQFEDWLKRWNRDYDEYRSKGKESQQPKTQYPWQTEMRQQLASLSNILSIQEIKKHLTGIEQLILVPHRDLHRFPLHSLFSEKFEITYLPSLQMGLSLQKVQRDETAKPSLLSVEAPNSAGLSPLNFAILESGTICNLFCDNKRLQGEAATKEQVRTELANSYNAFHFAGHGLYNFHDPKSSELALAYTDSLTLAEIRQQNLSYYQLVTLSACETAITGNQTITTEYVGLVSGFLSMGVSHVVSTLWTVESAASALVMIEFYRRWQAGTSKAKALAAATYWLRNLTSGELQTWYERLLSKLSPDQDELIEFIETESYKLNKMEQDKKLYEHPYYWAAFIITGNI
jgi:CHAT domain-containing protein/Flp pilus assembly protein TadD